MQTLIIYDSTGFIISQMSGDVREPIGIPFMWVEIPKGHYIKEVDTTKEPHEPIFRGFNEIDYDTLNLEELKALWINKSKENLDKYLSSNPIVSTCHGEIEKYYSITKDKQTYLTQMIMMTQLAMQAGIPYQPSWNATGEECTYDWTIIQLQQLAFEIENVVRPLVSLQQAMEAQIKACTTKEEVLSIHIEFESGE